MSIVPPLRGTPLYRYIPGTGRVTAVQCSQDPTETFITACSTSDQSLTAGTAALIAHDTTTLTNGMEQTGGTFTILRGGVYKLLPSVQYLGAGNGELTIWIKVNGTNVANSATLTHFKQNDEGVIVTEYILSLVTGDTVEVWALTTGANCTINYIAAGGSAPNDYPAAPGVITNMYRIRIV